VLDITKIHFKPRYFFIGGISTLYMIQSETSQIKEL